ncbi:HTH-type transcriptional regulator McbR [Mycobacterium shottsii]|uniref:GntR family transcriptional regulator n=1 Tax=Mycobacterium shottsii TaxID=133549 RepID=A0A7I7LLG0_9MYCO|nr:GntR family transcriptional regulator [Mycobacterium shottsii]QYL30307.1 HTH-type transcriptional regulator McbR [Mycobacterium shottsii]BBX54664.1 GntR family transcriptional regulator [Mycobacterium shottsii]BBX60816.1 GntR family transcriptional regulator [Mycobacterium shottsii]
MTDPEFAARPQLPDDVARYVRKRIYEGNYAAGKYIRLDQLAAELGISVTPVREALFALRAEGLVAQQPHRGFVVLPLTKRDLADVAYVQAHVGGELAARAAINIGAAQLAELQQIQAQLEEAYAADDDERTVRLNHEFHRAINLAADSPRLSQLMSQITRYQPESVFPGIEHWPARAVKDHRRVLVALKKHDDKAARTAMSEHLASSAVPLIDHLIARGVVAESAPSGSAAERARGG